MDNFEIILSGGQPLQPLKPNKQPDVISSPHLSGEEREYAYKCKKAVDIIAGKDETKRGRKRKYTPYTDGNFKSFVKKVYRELLNEKDDINTPKVRKEVRDRVRTIKSNYVNIHGFYQEVEDTSTPKEMFDKFDKEFGLKLLSDL